jgi:Ca2+/Na+ antiporter
MTETDVEWQQLQRVWNEPDQGTDARVAALHRAVRGQARMLRLAVAGEIALTVVAILTLASVWARVPGPRTAAIIAAALVHTTVIWGYAIWNRSGHWKPVADTLRQAVSVRRAHYRRRLATYRFVLWLSAIEGALLALVLVMTRPNPIPILLTLLFLAGAVAWTIWDGKRLRRELEALDRFAAEFEDG